MPRPSDPELRQWWRELLNSFDSRRYTVAQFCDQNDISVASFYKWRKRFSQAEQAPTILPVQIMGRLPAPEMAAVIRIGGHALIEIQAGHSQMATDIAVALARLTLDGDNTGNQEVTR